MTAAYDAVLDNWDAQASVRAKPQRTVDIAAGEGQLFFRPEGVAGLGHPAVRERGPQAEKILQVRRLYRYMDDIAFLEMEIINRAMLVVTHEGLDIDLSPGAVVNAYKIITDEGYHALVAVQLKEQVGRLTGIAPPKFSVPRFYHRFTGIVSSVPSAMQPLAQVIGAVVNETLISLNLAQANDPRLHPMVRAVINDHAEDEAVHHRYFSALFEQIWNQLDAQQRVAYGMLVPAFMRCFLDDDPSAVALDLRWIGFLQAEIDVVCGAELQPTDIDARARDGARPSMRFFRRCGLFEHPDVARAFADASLGTEGTP
jgi:P-aminobenzoate N-oxygenase AurF